MNLPSPNTPAQNSKSSLYWLIAVSLFANVIMSGGRVASSLFALQHYGSESLAGVAYSFYSLMPALLSLHMGRWIDRVGPRKVMRISLIIMLSSLILPVLWQSMIAVLLAAAFSGLGFGGYMLAANMAVGMMPFDTPNERVGMFGWLQMGNSFSAVMGPSVAGLVIDHFGFRATFATLSLFVVGSLICSFCAKVSDAPRVRPTQTENDEHILRTVLNNSNLLRIFAVSMTISLAWDGFVFMAPLLGHARGYSATAVGLVLSAFACGTFTVRALLPWLSRRMTEWRMLSVAFGISAGVFLILPWIHGHILHATMGFVFGLAAGAVQPNVLNLVYRNMPIGREGEGVGLRSMMGNLMGLTGPSVFGAITSFFGVAPVFLLVGFVMGASSWQARRSYKQALTAE